MWGAGGNGGSGERLFAGMLSEVGRAEDFASFSSFASTSCCRLSVSPDLQYICFASGKQLILWNSQTNKMAKFAQ